MGALSISDPETQSFIRPAPIGTADDETARTSILSITGTSTTLPATTITLSTTSLKLDSFMTTTIETEVNPLTPITESTRSTETVSGAPTGSAATSQTSGNPVVTPGKHKLIVPVLAGVMGGLSVLISGIVLWFLVRRRRRIRKINSQEALASPIMSFRMSASASLETGGREPNRTVMEEDGARDNTPHPDIKTDRRLTRIVDADEAAPSMRYVTELREEMAALRQLLVDSQQSTGSYSPSPSQTEQLSELREEVQRLRHLVSLQSGGRRGSFDGVSRSTSLPAYED